MIKINDYISDYVTRKSSGVINPKPVSLKSLKLPKRSCVLYLTDRNGPRPIEGDPFLNQNKGSLIYCKNITRLSALYGKPKVKTNIDEESRQWLDGHSSLKRLKTDESSMSLNNTIVLYNYSFLTDGYKYKRDKLTSISKRYNLLYTAINHLEEIDAFDMNFIYMDAPENDFKKRDVDKYIKLGLTKLAKVDMNLPDYVALQIVSWANNEYSLFNELPRKTIEKTVLIFATGEKAILVPMELLYLIRSKGKKSRFHDVINITNDVNITSRVTELPAILTKALASGEKMPEEDIEEANSNSIQNEPEDIAAIIEKAEKPDLNREVSDEQAALEILNKTSNTTGISANRKSSLKKAIIKASENKNPYGDGLAKEFAKPPEDVKLRDTKLKVSRVVVDESMSDVTTDRSSAQYDQEILDKDKTAMIDSFNGKGLIINSHTVDTYESELDAYEMHRIQGTLINGTVGTIHMKVPKLTKSGTIMANGSEYILRKQKGDVPIRKVKPDEVAISSYVGKVFVKRSSLATQSIDRRLTTIITKASLDPESGVTASPFDVSDPLLNVPKVYHSLSTGFREVITPKAKFFFRYSGRAEYFKLNDKELEKLEGNKYTVAGKYKNGDFILIDLDNNWHRNTKDGVVSIGTVTDVLELDLKDPLIDLATVQILGTSVPAGILLGYSIGLSKLLKLLEVNVEVIPPRQRVKDYEYPPIQFEDCKIVLTNVSAKAAMILKPFYKDKKIHKKYKYEFYDDPGIYINIGEDMGIAPRVFDEIDHQVKTFLDPKTKQLLKAMEEPTEYLALLIRGVELLETSHSPDPTDFDFMRAKGNERIAGAMYREMANSIRAANSKVNASKKKIEMSPYATWQSIMQDPAKDSVKAINPIQELKEREAMTLSGAGGRSKDTITPKDRQFNRSDFGSISDATPDGPDVGNLVMLAPGAKIKDIHGFTDTMDSIEGNASSALSTTSLLTPMVNTDDPKRVNMINVQASHVTATVGSHVAHVRTGYEAVIAQRSSDKFVPKAVEDGKIIEVTDQFISVKYKSGEVEKFSIGKTHNASEGTIYPTTIKALVKKGQTVKKGTFLGYNEDHFDIDPLDKNGLAYKTGFTVRTMLIENANTHEDSSAITTKVAEKLGTRVTKAQSFTIDFTSEVFNLVKIGQSVSPDDHLFVIEDEATAQFSGDSSDETIEALKELTNFSPVSGVEGVISKIVVRYRGEKDDTSSSIRNIINASDRRLNASSKFPTKISGFVGPEYRVKGKALLPNTMEIMIYIDSHDVAGVSDKAVFGFQAKSTFGEIIDYKFETEDGVPLDAMFSYKAFEARLINTPILVGMETTILKALPELLLEEFDK